MKKFLPVAALGLLAACQTTAPNPKAVCLPSQLAQTCLPEAAADIRFLDELGQPVAVILSKDRQQAEVFRQQTPKGVVLTTVKGGFVSDDGAIRLLKTESGWWLSVVEK